MNSQARDLVAAMKEAGSVPTSCSLCGCEMGDDNRYSPFATVCRCCTDEIKAEEEAAYNRMYAKKCKR